jgi:hypothetical protein
MDIIDDANDKIRGLNLKLLGRIEEVEEVREKLIKIKSSLMTNVLTLKVL